ncbi:MAG: hypothetical protein ACRDL6_08810 [Solirubrobacterales bacterium]
MPAATEAAIAAENDRLAESEEIPYSLRLFLDELADEIAAFSDDAALSVDPYLWVAAQRALIGALRVLGNEDAAEARRQMRIRLEQLRQVFRDIAEGGPLYRDASTKELARWLTEVLDTPQAQIAELFSVSPRTFQRWVSTTDKAAPDGEDARRVRIIAAIVNQLRHTLTAPGVLAWFRRPHPDLDGAAPIELLDESDALTRLTALAASTRSLNAA